ncbi:hypothetical protein K402DRAFT_394102 [Aulographum hederae CBS 113979]|uniref:Rhodanese domain-containing protein n=1 Tax=Aulographum hederae CBS 113979 TaxID=1176131 RepID=A0A6G1GZ50_9PEZI|nr:hypothetical protein K402DRAFT_394102 [Aulographum hederae CBS 113979]
MPQEPPPPTRTAPLFSPSHLLRMYAGIGDVLEAGMLLVDVRRNDYEGGTLRGSLNLPAQSFYMNRKTLYRLCKGDGVNVITRVIFYCGSSTGRGPRCAGWFADYVAEVGSSEDIPENMLEPQVFTLEDGIKGWVKGGKDYQYFMDGFDSEYWTKLFSEQEPKTGEKREAGDHGPAEAAQAESPTKRRREGGGI